MPATTAKPRTLRTFKGAHFFVSVCEDVGTTQARFVVRPLAVEKRGRSGSAARSGYTYGEVLDLSAVLANAKAFVVLVEVHGEEQVQRLWDSDPDSTRGK